MNFRTHINAKYRQNPFSNFEVKMRRDGRAVTHFTRPQNYDVYTQDVVQ